MSDLRYTPGSLSVGGGGGGSFDVGAETDRTEDAVPSSEMVPADLTKATLVLLRVVGDGAGGTVQLGSYNGNTGMTTPVPDGQTETAWYFAAAGETYYFAITNCVLVDLYERTLG